MGLDSYPKVRVTTDIVILTTEDKELHDKRGVPDKGVQVLLIKRKEEPFKQSWTLPGGFVDFNKPLIDTVMGKLRQKTGVHDIYVEQLYTYGDNINRDPRDRVISVAYIALVSKDNIVKLNLENGDSETDWFWVESLRDTVTNEVKDISLTRSTTTEIVTDLGFDHKKMIIDALNRVGNKVVYTDIGFNLVHTYFTIKELQLAYEALVGKGIPAFRRQIMPKIEEVGLTTTNIKAEPELHRPAKLYRKRGA